MADTSIRVSEELADELYERKGRSTSYEDYIWQLLDEVDSKKPQPAADFDGVLTEAHQDFADDPDQRRQARVDSLRAAIEAVRDEPMSKSELQKTVYQDIDVDIDQNERTWFRKTIKPYLKEVAEYSNSDQKWHYGD